ncbi:MAG: dephospho-CoA kinase [bacterium]|nr:dephospho-CoA kinase [bacterium]
MIRWIVTGPAGAGKSLFTATLADEGAAVLDGDTLGHEILARPQIVAAVGEIFGSATVQDGAVDRAALGALVFADPDALARLNALVHPDLALLMNERFDGLAREGCVLAVLEAAVYFLLPTPPAADLVVAVLARRAVRQERLEAKGLTRREAEDRLAAQTPMADLYHGADLVVENNGEPGDLARAARHLWRQHGPAGGQRGQNEEMGT